MNTLTWKGVVAIERPDVTKAAEGAQLKCRVLSARLIQHNGRRAIVHELPYEAVKHYFRDGDLDSCYCYAELHGDHLQIYERASQREFFVHPEQFSQPAAPSAPPH